MGALNTARTRIGLGGPSINYTRPFLDKGETIPPEPEPAPPTGAGGGGGVDDRGRSKRWRQARDARTALAARLRELYEGVQPTLAGDDAPEELAEAVADAVSEYAPPSAPDIPAPPQIDWEGLAEAAAADVRQLETLLRLVELRIGAVERQRNVLRQEDEAAVLLLLTWP